jgi:DNA-binding NarL/FixJ family response regulator
LKLKFTTKEIAEYTFVSIKAIQNRKNRLRKRLFIENDTDLYDWIDGL